MKRVVNHQRLAYVASVCSDGTPNMSPKGTTAVWDDDHLVFAHLHSPQTVANIEAGNTSSAVTSPAYDDGTSEETIAQRSLDMYGLTRP